MLSLVYSFFPSLLKSKSNEWQMRGQKINEIESVYFAFSGILVALALTNIV